LAGLAGAEWAWQITYPVTEGVGDHEKCCEPITKSAELAQIIGTPFSLSS
jgi:hypothetical protein